MNEDGFDLRGILPMRDGAPPSELVVRSLRGDPEPLLAWQTERIEKLEQEVEILRQEMKMLSCNLDPDATIVRQVDLLNIVQGFPILIDSFHKYAGVVYGDGRWQVVATDDSFWAVEYGQGQTLEEALGGALEEMVKIIDQSKTEHLG